MACKNSRSPSWGAWIEIGFETKNQVRKAIVAPPRGERGLKYTIFGRR